MLDRVRHALRAAALCFLVTAGSAHAAPYVMSLGFQHDSGDPAITYSGTVTFDDSIWTPGQNIFNTLTGLIAVNITATGPGIPGGSTSFTVANISGWVFYTDGANQITDLNFFMIVNNAAGCRINGVDPFLLALYCSPIDEAAAPLAVKQIVPGGAAVSSVPVPALHPALLPLLGLLLAAVAAVPSLRRRR